MLRNQTLKIISDAPEVSPADLIRILAHIAQDDDLDGSPVVVVEQEEPGTNSLNRELLESEYFFSY